MCNYVAGAVCACGHAGPRVGCSQLRCPPGGLSNSLSTESGCGVGRKKETGKALVAVAIACSSAGVVRAGALHAAAIVLECYARVVALHGGSLGRRRIVGCRVHALKRIGILAGAQ